MSQPEESLVLSGESRLIPHDAIIGSASLSSLISTYGLPPIEGEAVVQNGATENRRMS
jgi:hypothetical protein